MKACIGYEYEKDYILEAMLQDKVRQESKAAFKRFDLRKTTKTSEARMKLGREKVRLLKEKETSESNARNSRQSSQFNTIMS